MSEHAQSFRAEDPSSSGPNNSFLGLFAEAVRRDAARWTDRKRIDDGDPKDM
ncbi:hypothetical protein [Rhodococcoides fascians]|uniref:hypothetical protein n=1 Tax=Rhodococcoides fascians TaxID=1828 RepID=UPI000A48D7F0|nr:hypothetical protein [Rhodococcus fascians]